MFQRMIVAYSLPAAVLIFCWLTMGASAAYDHDVFAAYGFPFQWYAPSVISPGGYEIAVGPLIVDVCVYFLITHALLSQVSITHGVGRLLKAGLWVCAIGSLAFSAVGFEIDPHVTWWGSSSVTPPSAQVSHFISVGIQPRPLLLRVN